MKERYTVEEMQAAIDKLRSNRLAMNLPCTHIVIQQSINNLKRRIKAVKDK